MENKEFSTLYELATVLAENEDLISTAWIQRHVQIPYTKARAILDKMIEEGFCGPQVGSQPCKILAKKN